jgi:integrase/recombinase XerC/integrase/recombinase XerD
MKAQTDIIKAQPITSIDIAGMFKAHLSGHFPLRELVNKFLNEHPAQKQTRATYRRNFERFLFWYESKGQPVFNRQLLKEYRRYLETCLITADTPKKGKTSRGNKFKSHISPYTANNYLTTLKTFVKWLNAEAGIPDFSRQIKLFTDGRASQHSKDALTREQVKELFETPDNLRDAALIRLKVVCALRTVELQRANIGDIRTKDGEHVIFYQAKGRRAKDKFKVIPPDTYALLMRYIATRKDIDEHAPLFASTSNRNKNGRMTERAISGIIKNAMRGAELVSPRLSAHSLRHTGITLLIESGATLHDAQALAGHANPATTQIYFHNRKRIQDAPEKALEAFLNF